jgi:hypothetical protein
LKMSQQKPAEQARGQSNAQRNGNSQSHGDKSPKVVPWAL